MTIEDIRIERDMLLFIGTKFNEFKNVINEIFRTKEIKFYGTEWTIGRYSDGCGRVDVMYGNGEMLVPMELKYVANANSYYQIKKYTDYLINIEEKEINGILLCYKATKTLKELNIDDNIAIIELSTSKVW